MSSHSGIWSKTLQLVELATKLTIVGVPVLYFMGWTYLETYWGKFGLSETLLGLTAADYLRSGAFVLMLSIAKGSSWVVSIACISILVVALLIVLRLFAMEKLFAITRKLRACLVSVRREASKLDSPRHRRLGQKVESLVDLVSAGVMSFLITFLFLIGLILVGIQPSKAMAEENAKRWLAALTNPESMENKWLIAHMRTASEPQALVIGCGNEVCGLLVGNKVQALPRDAITRMEACRKIRKSDSGTFQCI